MRDEFHKVLSEEKVDSLLFGGSYWNNVPEGKTNRVDTAKLKNDGIYDDYVRMVDIKPSIATRWAKE